MNPVRRVAAVLALTVALVAAVAGPAAATDHRWRGVLDRAAQAAEKRAYVGESLWITYDDGEPSVSTFMVQSTGDGEITVADRTRYAVRLGDDGGSLADHERGWFFPLPAADLAKAHKGLNRLESKYDVEIVGREQLLDRPCLRLEITRRSDGQLVERLWVDDTSGLLLRRETYAGADTLLRMVSYLRLDLDPSASRLGDEVRATRGQRPGQVRREQLVLDVDDQGRAALRSAGWVVPEELPGGYLTDGAFAVSAEQTQPLQTVYSDGLYTVSLFEQRGSLDPATLPEGAVISEAYGFPTYTWKGAVPQRVVWEARGSTWSLVGDAPPDEFAAIIRSLPAPQPDGFGDRMRRGFGRLWAWVSPWA
jgi:hypothetical protein